LPARFPGRRIETTRLAFAGAVLPGQRWNQTSFPPGTQNRRAN
jgi:hypothetical protein